MHTHSDLHFKSFCVLLNMLCNLSFTHDKRKILTNLGWVYNFIGVTELAAYIKILHESTHKILHE